MKKLEQGLFVGERALYNSSNLIIEDSTFENGESPLKESNNIKIYNSIFKWKYPLWYCHDIFVKDSTLLDTARSGIWYTDNIEIIDSTIEAPKTFRRAKNIKLKNVYLPNAEETLWTCENIRMEHVVAKGNYFGMNSKNIAISDFNLDGNYAFDGASNIEIHNAKMLSKDSFWNCDNVTVYDSYICGEYLGWNSKNITFVNCVIESLQGMCYMENLVMKNCRLLNTTLAFEYSTVDVEVDGTIESVKNPSAGVIKAEKIKELILEEQEIDPSQTTIIVNEA